MTGVLANVDLRTQLARHNHLESRLFGINVFKVREAIHCPPITSVPD